MPQRILHLTLKKKWFDMIASGEKKEEYRDDKPYWFKRFYNSWRKCMGGEFHAVDVDSVKEYDIIRFRHGYAADAPVMDVEFVSILFDIGEKRKEWGYEGRCFVIKLGKILSIKNYNK